MSIEHTETTLADECAIIAQRAVGRACNDRNILALCGDYGEDDPLDTLAIEIAAAQSMLARILDQVIALQSHRCEYDHRDYCRHCGRDGRA